MKNFLSKRFKTLIFIGISALTLICSYLLFKTKCFGSSCDSELLRGSIFPLFWLGVISVPISLFFLFFQEAIFKLWFKRIAWWYFLILFILTASTPIYSSNILAIGRSQLVLGGMIILALITIPFVLVMKKRMV